MPSPGPGEMRTRVKILGTKITGQDAHGALTSTKEFIEGFWAKVTAKGGQQIAQPQGNTVGAYVSYTIETWHGCGVSPGTLLAIDGHARCLRVNASFDPDGRRKYTTILATEVTA